MALLEKYLFIKRSGIPRAGKGLFTKIPICKGQLIVEYKGKIQPWKVVKHLDGYNGYLMYINRNVVIDAEKTLNSKGRYANDANGLRRLPGVKNNAVYSTAGNKCFIEATRTIPAGSEILVSYGRDYWELKRRLSK